MPDTAHRARRQPVSEMSFPAQIAVGSTERPSYNRRRARSPPPGETRLLSWCGCSQTRRIGCSRPVRSSASCGVASSARGVATTEGYLVDPASSHMLVSKIKPCMSKYKPVYGETANGSLNQLWFLRSYNPTWITVVILELIHAHKHRPLRGSALLLDQDQSGLRPVRLATLDNFGLIVWPRAGDASFKCLPYQLSTVRDMPTVVITGSGESGFDSGEGA